LSLDTGGKALLFIAEGWKPIAESVIGASKSFHVSFTREGIREGTIWQSH
jgi:hypothetical protein